MGEGTSGPSGANLGRGNELLGRGSGRSGTSLASGNERDVWTRAAKRSGASRVEGAAVIMM